MERIIYTAKMLIGKGNEQMPVYVTMTDKALSGWGMAYGKKNKLVFVCKDREEAEIVVDNALNRKDQTHVTIRTTMPSYSPKEYYTQFKTKEEYPEWYQKGYFSKQKERRIYNDRS